MSVDRYTRVMRFTKMHGIGNDYVYIDGRDANDADFSRIARLVSDRHVAIGSDGLIAVCRPSVVDADVRMRMFNADGSEGEMCGNGLRCVVKYAVDRGFASANPLRVETGRGVLTVSWQRGLDGRVATATVEMGAPILTHRAIPAGIDGVSLDALVVGHRVDLTRWGDQPWWREARVEEHVTLVSMGNPHVILCCEDPSRVPLEIVGPRIERDPWFPARINVHFVRYGPRLGEAVMRTWERGSGITLACGTGASAVCVAGVLLDRCAPQLHVQLPGGPLALCWDGDAHHSDVSVRMTGPATFVFDGEVDLEALAASQPWLTGASHV